MAVPETLSVGTGDRQLAHLAAQAAVGELRSDRAPLQAIWWVEPNGWLKVQVRLDGGTERIFEVDPNDLIAAVVSGRVLAFEAHAGP